jgi:hypothetical protein
MKDYLSPGIEVLALVLEQPILSASASAEANRENYDSFDLFE